MQTLRVLTYYASGFMQGVAFVIIPAASTIFKSPGEGGISDAQYGYLTLPMITAAILSTSFLPKFLSYFGRKKVYFLGLAANILYMLFVGLTFFVKQDASMSFFLLMSGNLMVGIAFGLTVAVLNIYTVEVAPQKSDPLLTGLHACLGIGAAMSPQLIKFAHSNLGAWQMGAVLSIVLIAFVIFASLFFLPNDSQNTSTSLASLKKSKSSPPYEDGEKAPWGMWIFLGLIAVYAIIETTLGFWTSNYLTKEKGLSLQEGLTALSIFWILVTFGRVLASLLTFVINGWYLYLASPIVICGAIAWLVNATDSSTILFIYAFLGLGCSYFFPLSISLAVRTYPQWQEKISGLSIAALMAGVGLCNFIVGTLKERNYISLDQVFTSGGFISLILLVNVCFLFFFLSRQKKLS